MGKFFAGVATGVALTIGIEAAVVAITTNKIKKALMKDYNLNLEDAFNGIFREDFCDEPETLSEDDFDIIDEQ